MSKISHDFHIKANERIVSEKLIVESPVSDHLCTLIFLSQLSSPPTARLFNNPQWDLPKAANSVQRQSVSLILPYGGRCSGYKGHETTERKLTQIIKRYGFTTAGGQGFQ